MGFHRGACGRPDRRLRAALIFLALFGALLAAPNALAGDYKVTSAADPGDGVCTVFDCTLREAIDAANGDADASGTISFEIGIGGSYTISPATPLPDIDKTVTVDATTQTGYAGAPLITLNGSLAGDDANGLIVNGGTATIEGLAIINFGLSGIALSGSSTGSIITGNYIGIGSGGAVAQPNLRGVLVATSGNIVGGTNAAARNVISGNATNGIFVLGPTNNIWGNYVGLDASGNFAVPNENGVVVGANGNTIGGSDTQRNVISGNESIGLAITNSSNNNVRSNYIGTNADGDAAVGNIFGILIRGGTTPANTNEIGGGNVISGNETGILIGADQPDAAQDNSVWGSFIGTAADGKADLGNSGAGIAIQGGGGIGNNAIGSIDHVSEQNTIAFNAKGISLGNDSAQNEILINSIHDNTFLGIDLGDDGVTPNDPGDDDGGANNFLNFPVLSSQTRDAEGRAVVDVDYDGPPGTATYRFDFYASPACDKSGKTWIGNLLRIVDGAGNVTFNTDDGLSYAAPDSCITATATDPAFNTSEFSSGVSLVPVAGATLTVDTTDGGPSDGSCTDGDCSLGDAINVANATPGPDTVTIAFSLPGAPPFTISQSVPLPAIVHDVLIDGTTQGALVQVDGAGAGGGVDGLSVKTGPNTLDGSTIRGLSITGFTSTGISLTGLPSVLEGNYVGLAPDGSAKGNGSGGFGEAGILVDSDNNRVGGTTVAARNVISGNDGAGVEFGSNGSGNVVLGNRIGTNPGGLQAVPNTGAGISFEDALGQTIGGTANGAGNLISGNGADGIFINSGSQFDTARIQGNTIGLDAEGATPLPNAAAGVRMFNISDAHLGGTTAGAGNVISGNTDEGVVADGADGAVIQGNLIGLDTTGAIAVANGSDEVAITSADGVRLGGTTPGARNVIAGGGGIGVSIAGSDDAVVQGNYIGTDKAGEIGHGFGVGVNVFGLSDDDTIGGVVPGAGNVISDSLIGVHFDSTGTGHRVLGNSIGTDKDETDAIPNDVGIEMTSTAGAQIGSTTPGAGNVIAGSDDVGILLRSSDSSNTFAGNFIGTDRTDTLDLGNDDGMRFLGSGSNTNLIGPSNVFAHNLDQGIELNQGTGNRISANSFHDNGNEAIFLNDGGNANNNQEAPTLATASKNGSLTTINGTLSSAIGQTYFVEFFSTPTCTGQPQGKTYLGFQTVTTNGAGDAPLSFSSSIPASGEAITATATHTPAPLDTSEFSSCTTVLSGGGLLVGSVAVDPPVTPVNLTAEGKLDWAIWGYASGGTSTSLAPDTRKSGGSAISDLTDINPDSINRRGLGQFPSPPFLFDWTDGDLPTIETNAKAGLQHNGEPQNLSTLGHGFAFDVPADTNPRTLKVYVATNRADGQLTASLSDGSASDFTNTLVHAVDLRSGVYTITYAAASAGQTLHVSWIETLDNCADFRCDNAAIYAVTLSAPLVVNTADDHDNGTCDDTDCSLREAINAANAASGGEIRFDLPAGQTTISPTSNLPTINAPTTIDATTQPGFTGTPLVTLDGSSNSGGGFTPGFFLLGDNITIRGFAIIDFDDAGIYMDNSNGSTIAGNYIGMDAGGSNSQNGDGITLVESSDGNTIGGTGPGDRNVISANGGFGINLEDGEGGSPDNNTIAGNYIGLKPDGTGDAGVTGNVDDGIRLDGNNNTIGGATAAARNYISANDGAGIRIGGASNVVKGNTIGLDTSGNPVANSSEGIHIEPLNAGAPGNTIGDTSGGGNVISGNSSDGIDIADTGSTTDIAGNLIGTDPTGSSAIGNGGDGIHAVDATFVEVRGNTISGNTGDGVHIFGVDSFSNIVEANKIGTNSAGTAPIGNTDNGVYLDESNRNRVHANTISGNLGTGVVMEGPYDTSIGNFITGNLIGTNATGTAAIGNANGVTVDNAINNVIGGPAIGNANTISGNANAGVDLSGESTTGNTVSGNTIGLNLAKSSAVPNSIGVLIRNAASGNTIGGALPLEPNVISGNTGVGVRIPTPSINNKVTRNAIDANGALGIDIAIVGITPNDSPDADTTQNFPTIANVATTTVGGSLSSLASTTFTIEVFESPTCDASTRGEGARYVGTTTMTTSALGTGTFSATVLPLQSGRVVTATATSPQGNTSEFSPCVATVLPPIATNLSLTPTPTTAPAGAPRVKLSALPPTVLLQQQSSQQSSPINQTPINQTPINQLAASGAPINQTPINQTPINQTGDSGFYELTQSIPALGNITLSSIPLIRTGGWAAVLSATALATIPQQSVTLRQVFALNPLPAPLQPNATNPITLGELDLSHSTLGGMPAMAFALGKLPLSQLLTSNGTTYTNWCLAALAPAINCGSTATVLSAGLQGAPINQTPINQTPINQTLIQALATNNTPINQTPINQTPINQTRIGALPINQTPINQTPINQTPINQLSLESILAANAPINQTPINQTPINQTTLPNQIFFCAPPETGANTINCSSASATLGSAFAAHAIRPGVTLGDLRNHMPASVLASWTIAELRYYDGMTIHDLLVSLPQPNTFTLADVLLLVLGSPNAQGLSFEGINVFDTGLAQFATGGSLVGYRAQFNVAPNGGPNAVPSPVTVTSTLGTGFAYVAGSSKLLPIGSNCATVSPPIADPTSETLSDGRLKLTWTVNTIVGNSYAICFTTRPGIVLGVQSASLGAQPGGGPTASALGTAINIGDTNEPNNDAGTAPLILNDSFYLSYLTSSSDVDYYRFAAPPAGTMMTFHLSHLPADYDLVVYGPKETELRPPITGAVPLDEPPVTDGGVDPTHATDPLPSQTLDDLLFLADQPVVGVSAMRNTDPEDIVVPSQGTGFYTVQVSGYNGATSPKPYMLRVATTPPRTTSTVPAQSISGTVGPALPTPLPTGLNTVFLVNRQRLQSIYGNTGASNVITALSNARATMTSMGFPNVVLSVDRYAAVQTAYSAWNANPGSVSAANGVVAAINATVDSQIRSQVSTLKYLVIVGGDKVIPFARLDDFTVTASNEAGYASTFGQNTDLFSALNAGQMLSDDPYGDTNPVPYLNRQLYIPELAVGRLVETPDEIIGTINRFANPNLSGGHLDPTTSLTTGYDFLFDGASRVNDFLGSRVGANNASALLDDPAVRTDSWALSNLLSAFLPPTAPAPSITAINGHASHYQFQPSDTTGGLFTTSQLVGPPATASLTNRLIFSMGCHAGLSVADATVLAAGVSELDWPQAYAQKGAGAYLGNTGYGYGDSLIVAYSEELNRLFAQRLAAGSTVGNALMRAKQAYYGELGVFGVYDEKAMAEFTLYGLPMWSVSGPGNAPAPAKPTEAESTAPISSAAHAAPTQTSGPLAVVPDPTTSLEAETFSLNPTNTERVTADGRYWEGPDGVQTTQLRPLQPKTLVQLGGTLGHGALITELTTDDTNTCVDPVYARPIIDLTGNEPELPFGEVSFPSKIQTVRTFVGASGLQQQLVLVTGQFFTKSCAPANPDPQVGVQRLFTHIGGRVFHSTSSDYIAPAFHFIDATAVGSNAAFAVDVDDRTPTGPGTVKQVLVGVRSGNSPTWTFVNLAQSAANPLRWTGGAPIDGPSFEYFVQAVDTGAGNVAVSTNKGFYFAGSPAPPAPTGGIEATLTGPHTAGWFTNGAGLSITAPPGVTVEASVDGGPFGPPPTSITSDGLHIIDVRASNGGTAKLFAPVDTTPPEIIVNAPANGAVYLPGSIVKVNFLCRDSGSGIVAATPCTGTLANGDNVDTSPTPATKEFTVNEVKDVAGQSFGPLTIHYTIGVRQKIVFASQRTADGDIYSLNPFMPPGFALLRLTTVNANKPDEQPTWSPDGSKIAFASKRSDKDGSGFDIWVMSTDGLTAPIRLTTAKGDDTAPAWSPTGTQIAFQSKRDPGKPPEIYVMNADGSNQTRLTNSNHMDIEPSWSPDGTQIAFMSDRMGGPNIWVMSSLGGPATQLTFTKAPEGDPAWSPNGLKIAYASKRNDIDGTMHTAFDIFVMDPNGNNSVRLTTTKGDDVEPTWSRDGLKIAFTSNRDGNPEIYVMNAADGLGQTRLTNKAGFDRQPDW